MDDPPARAFSMSIDLFESVIDRSRQSGAS